MLINHPQPRKNSKNTLQKYLRSQREPPSFQMTVENKAKPFKSPKKFCFEESRVGHNHTIENSPTLLGTTGNDLCQEMESLHPRSHLRPRGMKRKHNCHLTAPDGPEATDT